MSPDIHEYISRKWPQDVHLVESRLGRWMAEAERPPDDRLIRAVLYLATPDPESIPSVIELARLDLRDVLWQAEYDGTETRKRDFARSFRKNGLLSP